MVSGFFFNDTATTEIYTLSLHDALPIYHRSPSAGFQGVLTVAAKSLQSDRIVHGLEQQPCGVQVVEWVGLVAL